MNVRSHRFERLKSAAVKDGPRVGILSTWDVENNATRVLAAVVRQAGHHCTEIYFKDWISNHLDPATQADLEALGDIIRRQELNLLCISIRASAYAQQSIIITEYVQREFEIPVLWGGMHPTMEPEGSIGVAGLVEPNIFRHNFGCLWEFQRVLASKRVTLHGRPGQAERSH